MELAEAALSAPGPAAHIAERRTGRRFKIALDLRWKLLYGRKLSESEVGRTIDLSSSGLSFQTSRPLPAGANLEFSISWPVLLRNVAPLQLKVIGEVVRSGNGWAAVRIRHHDFRTTGLPTR